MNMDVGTRQWMLAIALLQNQKHINKRINKGNNQRKKCNSIENSNFTQNMSYL